MSSKTKKLASRPTLTAVAIQADSGGKLMQINIQQLNWTGIQSGVLANPFGDQFSSVREIEMDRSSELTPSKENSR